MPKLSAFLLAALCIPSLLPSPACSAQGKPAAAKPTAAMVTDQAIHDYILAHPEVMLQSIRDFDTRRKAAEAQQAQNRVHENLSALQSNSPTSAVAGTADPVTIVEFFDYRCGYCKKVQPTVAQLATRPGVRIVYKDLPILGPDSMLAAKAALAAEQQGGYVKFHDLLIGSQSPLTPDSIQKLAGQAGLDVARLQKDMESPAVSAAIARNMALAEKLSIQATPTFVVGDKMISGALTAEAFDGLIKTAQAGPLPASAGN